MKVASKITIPVLIKGGKFASNFNRVGEILSAFEGFTIDVTFAKRKNKRSNKQNNYYWGVIVPIFQNCIKEEWGEIWNKDDIHNKLLKTNCNYNEIVNEESGEILRKIKSTTENDTKDQENFHERCRQLCKNFFNTEIPLPDPDGDMNIEY